MDATAEKLVSLANENGGRDNISVTLVKVLELESLDILEGYDPNDPLDIATLTDVGLRRSHNEDAVGHAHDQGIVVLADAWAVATRVRLRARSPSRRSSLSSRMRRRSPARTNPASRITIPASNFAAINALFQDEPDTPESEEEDDIDWPSTIVPRPTTWK